MHAQHFDRDECVAAAALAVREGAEHAAVQLPDAQELLRVRCALHADLAQTRDVLARAAATRRLRGSESGVSRWTGLYRESLARK